MFNDKKITAHHAIIPTREAPSGLDADQQLYMTKLLYDIFCNGILLWNLLKQSMYFLLQAKIFNGRSVFIRDKGFKALIGSNKEDEDTNDVSIAQKKP